MVKRDGLKIRWLSACEGSNPFSRIIMEKKKKTKKCPVCRSTRLVEAIGGGIRCKKCGFVNKPLDKEKYKNDKEKQSK